MRYFTVREVADLCRCTVQTVRYWIFVGKLTTIKPGKNRLIEETSLRALMKGNRKGATLGSPRSAASAAEREPDAPEFGCDFDRGARSARSPRQR